VGDLLTDFCALLESQQPGRPVAVDPLLHCLCLVFYDQSTDPRQASAAVHALPLGARLGDLRLPPHSLLTLLPVAQLLDADPAWHEGLA
jgi:hypothetical protein